MTIRDNPKSRDLPKDVTEILKAEANREKKLRSDERVRRNKLAKSATAKLNQASDRQRSTAPRPSDLDVISPAIAVLPTGLLLVVLLTLTFVIIAILTHTNAPRIVDAFPQLTPLYDAYVSICRGVIIWLSTWFESGLS